MTVPSSNNKTKASGGYLLADPGSWPVTVTVGWKSRASQPGLLLPLPELSSSLSENICILESSLWPRKEPLDLPRSPLSPLPVLALWVKSLEVCLLLWKHRLKGCSWTLWAPFKIRTVNCVQRLTFASNHFRAS